MTDDFPYFNGTSDLSKKPSQPRSIPIARQRLRTNESTYLASEALIHAVNVALLLGKPLLVTGEPGTGKTRLAFRIAWELGYDEPLVFETKSTSVSTDLFYYYDAVGRFHAANLAGTDLSGTNISIEPKDYINYNALGTAILRTRAEGECKLIVPKRFQHGGKRRSVVLIDEIDKAPRDFPNDILNELENLYFRIPELGVEKVEADPALAPVVVFTSNSEKGLPDAFLRRCIFHHIEFPPPVQLQRIILKHLENQLSRDLNPEDEDLRWIEDATALFFVIRNMERSLKKQPSTSELLLWIEYLVKVTPKGKHALTNNAIIPITLNILLKDKDDAELAQEEIERWLQENQPD